MLSVEDDDGRESHRQNYPPTAEIKYHNVMIVRINFIDEPIKIDLKT